MKGNRKLKYLRLLQAQELVREMLLCQQFQNWRKKRRIISKLQQQRKQKDPGLTNSAGTS